MSSERANRVGATTLLVAFATVSFAASAPGDQPLVGETTSKVLTAIASIIIERIGCTTLVKITNPIIDDAVNTYLRGNPKKALEDQEKLLAQKKHDSA